MTAITINSTQPEQRVVANIFCVGRNYAAHIAELGNRPEEAPLIFLKPTSSILHAGKAIELPTFSHDVHYETELVVLIGKGGKNIAEEDAYNHIEAYGLGLDLTARDIQSKAKAGGLPWVLGKGFDGAACVSSFVPAAQMGDPAAIEFEMSLNGERKQHGDVKNMLFPIPYIVHYLSTMFALQSGDLIFTGTPEGVGPLKSGDRLCLSSGAVLACEFVVA
jgi:2-keto-4-pentenoate hydratase/2-oxohepta-3-ene-1,7-dioic acid hydratase in catechol pathway